VAQILHGRARESRQNVSIHAEFAQACRQSDPPLQLLQHVRKIALVREP
jgi:hypothetical protein